MMQYANAQAAKAPGNAASSHRATDPDRVRQAHGAKVKINRKNAPNSGQQRHDNARQEILRHEHDHQRSAFHPSEYEGSTVTSISHAQGGEDYIHGQANPEAQPPTHVHGTPGHFDQEHEYEGTFDDSHHEEVEEDHDNGEESPLEHLNAIVLNQALNNGDDDQASYGLFDRQQEGDSYPPTTSGQPDYGEADFEELEPQPSMQHNMIHTPSKTHLQPHKGHIRADLGLTSPVPNTKQGPFAQHRPDSRLGNRQIHHLQNQHQITESTPPSGQNHIAGHSRLVHRSQTPPMTRGNQNAWPAYQQPTPSRTQLGTRAFRQQTDFINTRSQTRAPARSPSQGTIVQAQPLAEHNQELVRLADVELDYNEEELVKKPYEELQSQAFDDKLTAHTAVLAEEDASKPLSERLQLVQKMDGDMKQRYMASLSLEEWEEAGDWFLERFGTILNKMKDARKERRKLAKDFEEEVFKRDKVVREKKRGIEEALVEMNESGRSVLRSGTPKKARV